MGVRAVSLETMKSFLAKMPELERKVPLVKVEDRYFSAEEVVAGWADVKVREAAVRLLGTLTLPSANLAEISAREEEFIIHRIQVKLGLGMVAPFMIITERCPLGRRVEPKQLMRELSRRTRIGRMRIQAERKLLVEIARRSMGMGPGGGS